MGTALHELRILSLTALIADSEYLAGLLCSVYHFLSLNGVDRHRLFAHNVLARMKCVNGYKRMGTVRSTNVYCIDLGIEKQLLVIGINLGVGSTEILCCLFSLFGNDVAECNHLHVAQILKRGHMLTVCNTAASYNSDFYNFFTHFAFSFN